MKNIFIIHAIALCSIANTTAQIDYNANTRANVYDGYFLYGSNMGWVGGVWSDENVAEILIGNQANGIDGAGVTSLRPAMYDYFVEEWGYEIRLDAFKFYQQLGARDNVIFLNGPSEEHTDNTRYCADGGSGIFANLYEPIWTNGAVNKNNYYAWYVYNVAKVYGPYVKFWEVWNEPDFTYNWWGMLEWSETDPNPCDLANLMAPVQRYVRMLRITYEVVKSAYPDAFICIGGIGYSGFLESVLRNTDNPVDGNISSEYHQKGGAWFDCVSFHLYPMYYLEESRNSDAAAEVIVIRKEEYAESLAKFGYDGLTYPKKEFIITECNIPSKQSDEYIGSDEAQRNFLIKAAVVCQKSDIRGLYVYGVSDYDDEDIYGSMGLYREISDDSYDVTAKWSGVAWRTVSRLLKERRYDEAETDALKLPPNIDGAAFYSEKDRDYMYVLWAKQTGDKTETGAATYGFPAEANVETMTFYSWDEKESAASGRNINLTGCPVFIKNATALSLKDVEAKPRPATVNPNPNNGKFTVYFERYGTYRVSIADMTGKTVFRATVSGSEQEIDISAQPTGVFVVTVDNGARPTTLKIVKL